MEVSDVRVRLVNDAKDRLKAVCSVTLDEEFVVRDVKVVEGTSGLFVAMPSRKLSAPCAKCRSQNHLRARFCNECGAKLPVATIPTDNNGREKAHRDIAHPITSDFRQKIQESVLEAYRETCDELEEKFESESESLADAAPRSESPADATSRSESPADATSRPESRPESETEDKTSDERESQEVEPATSAYDSLIADLKGGTPRSDDDRGNRKEPLETRDRGDRGRRRGRGPRDDRDRSPRREPAETTPSVAKQEARPQEVAPSSPERVEEPQENASAFGAGIVGAPEVNVPAKEKQNLSDTPKDADVDKPVEAPIRADVPDEDVAFGAGLQ